MEELNSLKSISEIEKTLSEAGPMLPETRKLIEQAKDAVRYKTIKTMGTTASSIDEGYLKVLRFAESGNKNNARPIVNGVAQSSAVGPFQFIDKTWLNYFDKVFPELASLTESAKLALRTDLDKSTAIVKQFTADNNLELVKNALPVNYVTSHLSHFLGSAGAIKALKMGSNASIENAISKNAISANKKVFEKMTTVGDLINWSARKFGATPGDGSISSVQIQKLDNEGKTEDQKKAEAEAKKREEEERKLCETRKEVLKTLDKEIDGIGKSATEREIINTLEKAQLDLSTEEGRVLAEKVRQKNKEKDLQQDITDLQDLQKSLQSQIKYAQEQGDQSTAETLKERLVSVNENLKGAIEKSIAFWQGIGGPHADAAIEKLRAINTEVENLHTKFLQTAQQIEESVSGNITSGFAKFAESIANGENAITSLGETFRQFAADFLLQMGKMIMQQAVFNLMQANGFGGFIRGGIGSLFHEGGVAGQATSMRLVDPSWFKGASKYHSGGVAGLSSNEIPAILEKGETIRTEEQERQLNQRLGGSSNTNVKILNMVDSGEFVSQGLSTDIGEKAIINFIKANKSAVKSALS